MMYTYYNKRRGQGSNDHEGDCTALCVCLCTCLIASFPSLPVQNKREPRFICTGKPGNEATCLLLKRLGQIQELGRYKH